MKVYAPYLQTSPFKPFFEVMIHANFSIPPRSFEILINVKLFFDFFKAFFQSSKVQHVLLREENTDWSRESIGIGEICFR